MIPRWKIERELVRIKERTARRIARVREPLRQRWYDRHFETELRIAEGKVAGGSKIAIFVLFQPRGLARSVSLTCRHLVANGYSPLILSNAPLSDADRETLRGLSWRVVERPNFGYDFGAYRDGIRLLWRDGIEPEALVLMNDSTWFPLREADDSLARIEAMDAPFSGFVFKQEPYGRGNAWHVESHFLHFRREALTSDAFRTFWSGYPLSDDRVQTIVRGEKGISNAMMSAGFAPQSLVSFASFLCWAAEAPSATLRWVLSGATYHIESRARDVRLLLDHYADTPDWRLQAFAQISDMLNSLEFFPSTTFIHATMDEFGLPFVKKSTEPRFRRLKFGQDRLHLARVKVMEMHRSGEIPPLDPVVANEMSADIASFSAKHSAPDRLALLDHYPAAMAETVP